MLATAGEILGPVALAGDKPETGDGSVRQSHAPTSWA